MSKPFFADVGDFTTTNIGTSNETTANIGLADIIAQALVASISPADIGGTTQNNYLPAGLGITGIVNLTASSAATITGLDASVVATGRLIYLYALPTNVGNVTINNEDAGSLAANRIVLPGAAPAVMTPGSALALRYDGGSARWRSISSTSSTQLPSLIVTGPVTFSGTITPASLAANVNDYNPAGLSTTATIRQAINAGVTAAITGLIAQPSGRRLTIQNLGSGFLQFSNEDAASTAANRFTMPGAATWQLLAGGSMTFSYDGTTSRWRVEDMTNCIPYIVINVQATPATITGTINDYNPTGLTGSGVIRQGLTGDTLVTGLVAQNDGRVVFFENISAFQLTLSNEDLNSAIANRFTIPGASTLQLPPNATVMLLYDATSSRWRPIGQVGANTPGTFLTGGGFSNGGDGSVVFDGATTILGLVPVANVYTLARDIRVINMTVNGGVTVKTDGWRIFGTGTLSGPGIISCNGGAGGAGAVGGGAGAGGAAAISSAARFILNGGAGVAGGAAGNAGGTGASSGVCYQGINGTGGGGNPTTNGGGIGGGGGGGTGFNFGGNGGGLTEMPVSQGTILYGALAMEFTEPLNPSNRVYSGGAPGGGGSGGAAGTGGGGGSGAGGGTLGIAFRTINNTIVLQAKGGNGGAGAANGNTGGGGSGGGGLVVLTTLTPTYLLPVPDVSAGVAGAPNGTGHAGGTGAAGITYVLNA